MGICSVFHISGGLKNPAQFFDTCIIFFWKDDWKIKTGIQKTLVDFK